MKRLPITLFFITLILSFFITPIQAQEYIIIQPFVSTDRTYFFIGQEQGMQKVYLRNNSYITSPRLIILAMNPLINGSDVKLFNISIIDINYIREGNRTKLNITKHWSEIKPIQVHWKYFVENTIDLPTIKGTHLLIIEYEDIKAVLKYKMDPLLIRSQKEIMLMRLLATVYIAALMFAVALVAITISKKILDRVAVPPISTTALLLILISMGFFGYLGYTSLRFADPAMYTSINEFILERGIYIIAAAEFILLIFFSLHIFQREPMWILFLGIPKQELDEETRHLRFIAKQVRAMKIQGQEIKLYPNSIKEWFLYALGVNKKIIIKGDPEWYITEKDDEFDRIFFLKPFVDIQFPRLTVVLDLYPIILFLVMIFSTYAVIVFHWVFIVPAILAIILFYRRIKPKKVKEEVQEEGIKKVVEKEIQPEPIIEVKGRSTEIELASPAYSQLYKHFLNLLDKKRLIDQAKEYRSSYLELQAEFESRVMQEIKSLLKMVGRKMRMVRENEERGS